MFPNLYIPNQNSNQCNVLIQEWSKLGQQPKHTHIQHQGWQKIREQQK
jgi:hypothetical protein